MIPSYQNIPLWCPSEEKIKQAHLTRLMNQLGMDTYEDLYRFSIEEKGKFWSHLWEFFNIIALEKGTSSLINENDMRKATFFPNARLNFAENLLRLRGNGIALEFYGEHKKRQTFTHDALYQEVAQIADTLKKWGIQKGDCVVGYLPHLPQAIIAMLAAASIGAIWSSCSPDFGVSGVVDRFSQINPKVLFCADGYSYQGKVFKTLDKIPDLLKKLPTCEKVIIIPYMGIDFSTDHQTFFSWDFLCRQSQATEIQFTPLNFNHPLYILFSSGTTGIPKCIVHRAGGVLLQHMKEHQLHCDLKRGDRLFYFTTCGWMMWHWLVSGLASGATLILYEGSPAYPDLSILFDIAEESQITHFGTSAKFIETLAKNKIDVTESHSLSCLQMILSTGSPLAHKGFDYVYEHVKKEVCLASISGGTDIVSCFALGNPIAPVWAGELQTKGLGMDVQVFDENGKTLPIGQKGELVCVGPFPSQPLGFWNDPDHQNYTRAYFSKFPNAWHHGDFVELTPHQGLIIHGRSDAILNPGGVRIGTAEIYRQLEEIPEILESIAVGQEWDNDIRIILFVILRQGLFLDKELISLIKTHIKNKTTPRHVPNKIIQVPDIPRTKNGKIAELAVRQTIHGQIIQNQEALLNPDVLTFYENLVELTEV